MTPASPTRGSSWDGRTLSLAGYTGGTIAMGDSNDNQQDNYPAVFIVPMTRD